MKLFNINKKKSKFFITDPDREWVENNFKWLIDCYGYPTKSEYVVINERFFPKSLNSDQLTIENLVDDLAILLGLDVTKITFELMEDIRDTHGIPYEINGQSFETETAISDSASKIYIAKSLTKHPNRLVSSLIYEFIKIKLSNDKLAYDTGEDTGLFIYLAGIYFGFGVIISHNLVSSGRSSDGFWETKWSYVSEIPQQVMAYSLALHLSLTEDEEYNWENHLSKDFRKLLASAIKYLSDNPSSLISQSERESNSLFKKAYQEYERNDFDLAIETLQKILFLTDDNFLKADVYNNIGYFQTRKGEFEKSILNFHKALEFDPEYGYALNNLGYAYIKTGKLDEGKSLLEQALLTDYADQAYGYRNLALYYQAKGNHEQTEANFKLAFDSVNDPVDLLEFYYAEYLLEQDKIDEGKEFLEKAIAKNEPEAIIRMKELS